MILFHLNDDHSCLVQGEQELDAGTNGCSTPGALPFDNSLLHLAIHSSRKYHALYTHPLVSPITKSNIGCCSFPGVDNVSASMCSKNVLHC